MNSPDAHDFSFDQLFSLISEQYQNALSAIGHCNILIIGKAGVGKSTLINAVFREPLAKTGVGYPVTDDIRRYRKEGFPLTIYDSPGLELDGEQLQRITRDVSALIGEQLYNIKEQIHVIWYCVNHNNKRLEELELEWLSSLSSKYQVPMVLVVTQTLTRKCKNSKFITWLNSQNLPVRQIIPVLAEAMEVDDDIYIKPHGLENLVQFTVDLLPEVAQEAFVNATKSIQLKARKASRYVAGYTTTAGAIGASPIPFSDAPVLATAQIGMLTHITVIFGLSVNEEEGFIATLVSSAAGVTGTTFIGRALVSNLLKMIPGIGTVAGGTISAATASALTLTLGLAYIEALKQYFKSKLEGQEMSLSDIQTIFIEELGDYMKSGRKTLKDDDGDEGPQTIPIS